MDWRLVLLLLGRAAAFPRLQDRPPSPPMSELLRRAPKEPTAATMAARSSTADSTTTTRLWRGRPMVSLAPSLFTVTEYGAPTAMSRYSLGLNNKGKTK